MGLSDKDMGICCLVVPLKFGVGLIAMFQFSMAILAVVALFSEDVRLQANGYNTSVYYLPSIVNLFGLVFGIIGLLGVYDDKMGWVRAFNWYIILKLLVLIGVGIADFWTLLHCETYLTHPVGTVRSTYQTWIGSQTAVETENPLLYVIALRGVCEHARFAYVLGLTLDLCVHVYFAYCCFGYGRLLADGPRYGIDFGEQHGTFDRWRRFKVKEPYPVDEDAEVRVLYPPAREEQGYGATVVGPAFHAAD